MMNDNRIEYIPASHLPDALARLIGTTGHDRLFVLADDNTSRLCLPALGKTALDGATLITVPHGDGNKSLDTLGRIWTALSDGGATRHSLLINVGGGMVTDIGGFAAATFKRGIRFVNLPTTLLAMVDASVGGKTGINFNGLKNEVGAFADPVATLIHIPMLTTLPEEQVRSGYAEMVKHALLADEAHLTAVLDADISRCTSPEWLELIRRSVDVKSGIVARDRREQGLRKALNLGHTAGHAFESLALHRTRPVPHGYAVAWGMMVALYISAALLHFPTVTLRQITRLLAETFGRPPITCDDYDWLLACMGHDKKNADCRINLTLLADVGDVRIDQHAEDALIKEAFDFAREGF